MNRMPSRFKVGDILRGKGEDENCTVVDIDRDFGDIFVVYANSVIVFSKSEEYMTLVKRA